MKQEKRISSLAIIFSSVGLSLGIVSFFAIWWISIIGLGLGITGVCIKPRHPFTTTFSILAIVTNAAALGIILWALSLAGAIR